jgi:hypothetical protein
MIFLNDIHKYNFEKLVNQINLNMFDTERLALIYIISGNTDLFNKKNAIYDFSKNIINFCNFKQTNTDFCSSSKALIRLGVNLFNGYTDKYTDPLSLLQCLGYDNYELAINAIKLRFENF